MPAGTRDLKSAFCRLLAANFAEIERIVRPIVADRIEVQAIWFDLWLESAVEVGHDLGSCTQGRDGINVDALHDRGLWSVFLGDEEILNALFASGQCDRQSSSHRTHAAVERQLTDGHHALEFFGVGEVAIRAQDAQGDGQVKARPLLAEVGGGEIHRYLLERKKEFTVVDRSMDPLAALTHGGVGQADDNDLWALLVLAHRAQIYLDVHGQSINTVHSGRLREEEHIALSILERW